jgi:molybdate transport system substrate-binding protein
MRIKLSHRRFKAIRFLLIGAALGTAHADEATVAVAANFLIAAKVLEQEFESSSGHELVLTSGSTGQLYAQIVNGAPFDILLAADQERPRLLAENGRGDASSVFTYAIGRLVLWSGNADRIHDGPIAGLFGTDFRFLAIPEPDVAPYGRAAREVLERLGLWSELQPRIVKGQSVAQTFSMIETGNAQLGLVALSQALAYEGPASYRVVPPELYEPIRQDAVLLRRAAANAAARDFLVFLTSPAGREIIERFGYLRADPGAGHGPARNGLE